MKIYLAARYSRHPEMREVRDRLVAAGHEVTSRWIDVDSTFSKYSPGVSFSIEQLNSDPEYASQFADNDMRDVLSAYALVLFSENGESSDSKGGRHVEFGAALACLYLARVIHLAGARGVFPLNRVIVVGQRENVFQAQRWVEVVPDVDALIATLRNP